MNYLRTKHIFLAIGCISGLILYLELALIRYLPAHILYLGFFSNFVLLASFLGIGLGFLLGGYKRNLFLFFPATALLTTIVARLFSTGLNLVNNEVIFFRSDADVQSVALPATLVLPIVFIVVTVVFSCLGQLLAKLFKVSENPLKSYTFDIIGSIIGIGAFYITSFLGIPPAVWFSLIAVFFLGFVVYKQPYLFIAVALFIATIFLSIDTTEGKTFWSPYQKISLIDEGNDAWNLLTNNIHHQYFTKLADAPDYRLHFIQVSAMRKLDDVLIIGSGTGQDVNAALQTGAQHIDAVEIDPQILKIGKQYHPEHPYDSEKVTAINTDGRYYLHNTTKKYDVIDFALTDSLVLDSGFNQVRLESYLFTQEAFRDARDHLKDGGVLIMYNDYRKDWLIERLSSMIGTVFGEKPIVAKLGLPYSRMFISPPKSGDYSAVKLSGNLPTDNWPFLYLRNPGIPSYYTSIFIIIFTISLLAVTGVGYFTGILEKLNYKRLGVFFLLGAAFALIETKSIAQLNLLFGATWIVNGIAFTGILFAVLLATLVTRVKARFPLGVLLILLIVSLGLQYVVPLEWMLTLPFLERLLTAVLYFFLPIFFANLIFAGIFKDSQTPDLDFGSNVLGLVFGGVVEYCALISGYKSLTIVAGVFYLVALILLLRSKKTLA